MKHYYQITNEAPTGGLSWGKNEKIGEVEFRAAVGDRQPDRKVDVSGVLKTASIADVVRALALESGKVGTGAVHVWCLCDETGKAEGWRIF
jgi:hypothetical protein